MYSVRQWFFLYSVFLGSMLSGASVMHAILQPDLTIPTADATPVLPIDTLLPPVAGFNSTGRTSTEKRDDELK
jgi:hypothetical protein